MAVTLIVSETLLGAAFSDALAGGGTGIDFGAVTNGAYTPIISQAANTGRKDAYIRHNGTENITAVKTFVAAFSQTYGGADSAANDFTTLKAKGAASSSANANNDDGNAGGLHIEMDADVSDANQFDPSREGNQVRIYGSDPGSGTDSGKDGSDLTNAFTLESEAMVYDAPGETVATSPSDGVIGPVGGASKTTVGESAHTRLRYFLEEAATVGGILQADWVIAYSFTV